MQSWKRQFAVIYAGQAFSLLGSSAVQFAIIWWLTMKTESAITLTVATVVAFIPNMVLGPFAGVLIDRHNRRAVLIASDGLVALSSALLGLAFLVLGDVPVPLVYAIMLLRGIGNTFHSPALQAAIPMLVPREMLTRAGGWGSLVNSLSNMLGPVLGAALMGLAPIAGIMLVDVLGAAFAILCLLFVRIPDIPCSAERPHLLADMRKGLAAIRGDRPLMAVMAPMMLCNILYAPLGSLFPLLVLTHFGGTAWHNGVVEFVFAGGLLLASLALGVWGGMKRRFLMMSLAIGTLGAACAVSGLLPPSGFAGFVACCFVMGCAGTLMSVPINAYMQATFPAEVMGKVFSLLMAVMTLCMPLGLLVAGPVSEWVGVDRWFLWSGVALVLSGLLCRVLTRRYDLVTTA